MSRKVNMAKLLEKIAAVTDTQATELAAEAERTKDLYSYDEEVLQRQSVLNFYETFVALEEPKKELNESKVSFAKRVTEYNNLKNSWNFAICKGCSQKFVYAYQYRSVSYCSLECLDAGLRKIGLSVSVGRDLKRRWGRYHPAIVPATALETLEQTYEFDASLPGVPAQ